MFLSIFSLSHADLTLVSSMLASRGSSCTKNQEESVCEVCTVCFFVCFCVAGGAREGGKTNRGYVLFQHLQTGLATSVADSN